MEKKLKSFGLVVECAHLPETVPLLDELEDASKRGVLFGIIISSQHEVHRSVTVHILHGTQQGKFCNHVICTCVDVVSHVTTAHRNDVQTFFVIQVLWESYRPSLVCQFVLPLKESTLISLQQALDSKISDFVHTSQRLG